MLLELDKIPHALGSAEGFPRPNWAVIRAFVESNFQGEPRHLAVLDAKRQWLQALARHLGGDYTVYESPQVLLLSEERPRRAEPAMDFAEDAMAITRQAMEGVVPPARTGAMPVLAFTDEDDYAQYVRPFLAAMIGPTGAAGGTSGASAGVPPAACVRSGAVHVALSRPAHQAYPLLARELARVTLGRLPWPAWLEEGVVQVIVRATLDEPAPAFDVQAWSHHRSFWNFHGLEGLWDGAWFHRPEDERDMACQFAERLVRSLNEANPQGFNAFLRAAHRADHGEAASRQHLGASLSALAQTLLLGEGF